MNEEDKLIQDQFNRLPPELQKAIQVVPWKSSIKEIAVTNKLSLEQVEIAERETMFIIYGFESPDDYIANLMRETQIDEITATNIATAVDEKIFKEIALKMPETPVANLPMVEPNEKVHDVPHVELVTNDRRLTTDDKLKVPVPDYRYEAGKDPYREPLK